MLQLESHFDVLRAALLKYNSYLTCFTHLEGVIQWFLIYSQTCTTKTIVSFRTFLLAQKKPCLSAVTTNSPFPMATKLLPVSVELPYSRHFMSVGLYNV